MVHNEKLKLSGEIECVVDVLPGNEDIRIKVRIIRMWKVPAFLNPLESSSIEMVLIDEKGGKIHASIRKQLISMTNMYKFEFNENTTVFPSDNCFIPAYGFSLIGAEDVLKKKESFNYLVDVVGVVTKVHHDNNFYLDGRVTRSVSFRLNDQRRSFFCELSGKLDEEFQNRVKCCLDGLPIVVLQFAKINIVQGIVLVEGVEGITKIHVNPPAAEVINFRNGLLLYIGSSPNYGGLIRSSGRSRLSDTLDFLKSYPMKTIAELNADPQLCTFFVNARMLDIVQLDPWWFPMCKCNEIFDKYIGAFHCTKCNVSEVF